MSTSNYTTKKFTLLYVEKQAISNIILCSEHHKTKKREISYETGSNVPGCPTTAVNIMWLLLCFTRQVTVLILFLSLCLADGMRKVNLKFFKFFNYFCPLKLLIILLQRNFS